MNNHPDNAILRKLMPSWRDDLLQTILANLNDNEPRPPGTAFASIVAGVQAAVAQAAVQQ